MASTVLPNGIIIPEKYSRDWYNDLYHNWEELDNLLSASTPGDGTLTIQQNGETVGTFSANQATDETINLAVPTKTSDLSNDSGFITEDATKIPLAGTNALSGSIVPDTDNAYDFGSSSYKLRYVYCNTAYVTNLTINGTAAGDILTHNASEFVPVTGSNAITGTGFFKSTSDSQLQIGSGTSTITGGCLIMYGSEYSNTDVAGAFRLRARTTTNYDLIGYANGSLTWGTKNVAMQEDFIPRSGGAVITATRLAKENNNGYLDICGGTSYTQGGFISVRGNNSEFDASTVFIGCGTISKSICLYPDGHASCAMNFQPTPDNTYTLGAASSRWKTVYSATSTINTSDSRLKNTITDIDDSLLDAWETIQPKQYKFNDATESKGDTARFHTGYIAQDIQKACTDNDIDISKYGLFCYDSWEEEPEITEVEVEKDGVKTTEKRIVQSKKEKGDIYALRYEEALVVECAYLRRCIAQLTARIEQLESVQSK